MHVCLFDLKVLGGLVASQTDTSWECRDISRLESTQTWLQMHGRSSEWKDKITTTRHAYRGYRPSNTQVSWAPSRDHWAYKQVFIALQKTRKCEQKSNSEHFPRLQKHGLTGIKRWLQKPYWWEHTFDLCHMVESYILVIHQLVGMELCTRVCKCQLIHWGM